MAYNLAVAGDITAWFPLIKCIVGMASVDSCIHYRPSNSSSRNRAPEISPDYRSGFYKLLWAGLRWHRGGIPDHGQGDGGAILASESASASYLYGEAIEPFGSTSPPTSSRRRRERRGELHGRVGVGFPRGSSLERRAQWSCFLAWWAHWSTPGRWAVYCGLVSIIVFGIQVSAVWIPGVNFSSHWMLDID
jgi:hypothetical protein